MDRREKNMHAARSVGFEWCEMAGDHEQVNTSGFMKVARLDRIADVLESIDRDIKKLLLLNTREQ